MQALDPQTPEELETLLLRIWPSGVCNRKELFDGLNVHNPLDRSALVSALDGRTLFRVSDVAEALWQRSNYADLVAGQ